MSKSGLRTWFVLDKLGNTTYISAYTESDAYQQAVDFCGAVGIDAFDEQ